MKLYDTRSKKTKDFISLNEKNVRIYSCGPTVYDNVHIGNLSSFIYADTLRRVLTASGLSVRHVMNFTDIDDKTIRRGQEVHPALEPIEALRSITTKYSNVFLEDMAATGNDLAALEFITATESIEGMRQMIRELHADGFAYVADDGVYFSIEAYTKSGKKYGQLIELTEASTASERIQNDEYDKETAHDFALWKKQKDNEPSWDFELDGHNVSGRPGWHIECSVMSTGKLGQPFDIHTGGIDLIFPHHENEIAQSTAGKGDVYANYFVHNEHLLVEGKKMSKSLNNFYTLRDIQNKNIDPLAFRIMVLSSHYRNPTNFTWETLQTYQATLKDIRAWADLALQQFDSSKLRLFYTESLDIIRKELENDMKTPAALQMLNRMIKQVDELGSDTLAIQKAIAVIDYYFGLGLRNRADISSKQKHVIQAREQARLKKDWQTSDKLRDELLQQGIEVRDTAHGTVWSRA